MKNLIDKINNILENSSEQRSFNGKYINLIYQQNSLKYCQPWHTTIPPPNQKEIIAKFSYCSKSFPRELNPIIIRRWPDGPCTKTPKTTNVELASTIHIKHAKLS
jgi:hypothetical protein